MDKLEFELTLLRLSIKAIHELCGNTQDAIFVEEAIEHNASFRPILTCVQIWQVDYEKKDGYCDIHFILSPDFMQKNSNLTLNANLNELKWIFEMQRYDYGEDEEFNKIGDEDGLAGWLARSKIKVNYDLVNFALINLNEFVTAIQTTESD
jgi:hypothetical protein